MTVPPTPPALLAQIRADYATFGRDRYAAAAHVSRGAADRAVAGAFVRPATLHMLLAAGERLRSTSASATPSPEDRGNAA